MARLNRYELLDPEAIDTVHVFNRVVRRCLLFGDDPVTGKNYDHRKGWIEDLIALQAKYFAIDLLGFSIMSNHFHQILRSRPDVAATWEAAEVARHWLLLCPKRKGPDGQAPEPKQNEINSICNDLPKLKQIRRRLSDISWWMRLLCQKIAQRANREDEIPGKFWESRFQSVKILDETGLLACAAYVDLNPIRAALVELLEESDYTSAQRRISALLLEQQQAAVASDDQESPTAAERPDRFLSPLTIDELRDEIGVHLNTTGDRCSDKGFLNMSVQSYIELLDWTARSIAPGKRGVTPANVPAVLERLGLEPAAWCELAENFGELFHSVAGRPTVVDAARSRHRQSRFRATPRLRELFDS